MTESKPKLADINAMFSRCWGPLWDCLKVGGEKHGWESFRENDTELFINAGARHNTEVRKDQKSYDKDGFYHAAAVLANALMVLENVMRDMEVESGLDNLFNSVQKEGKYDGSYTGEHAEDLPSESKDDPKPMSFYKWRKKEGWYVSDAFGSLCMYSRNLGRKKYSEESVQKLYQEYLADFKRNRPDAQAT